MKLPELKQPAKYIGLYVIDFGDHTGVGFTAQEVAELLDSERYKNCKVYKIHKAYPDGTIELKGLRPDLFQLESGMFFYANNLETASADYKKLIQVAVASAPPCRAKVHLAGYRDDKFVTALIYPAEYDDEISSWLLATNYKTNGSAEGGFDAVQRYYGQAPDILQRHQLFGQSTHQSRTGTELLNQLKAAVQR